MFFKKNFSKTPHVHFKFSKIEKKFCFLSTNVDTPIRVDTQIRVGWFKFVRKRKFWNFLWCKRWIFIHIKLLLMRQFCHLNWIAFALLCWCFYLLTDDAPLELMLSSTICANKNQFVLMLIEEVLCRVFFAINSNGNTIKL